VAVKFRPVIVGMNNPHSDDPKFDLMPFPSGSAGHRLWKMLDDVRPTWRRDYCDKFMRINLLRATTWNLAAAREQLSCVLEAIPDGSTVLLLGRDVQRVFQVSTEPMARERRHNLNLVSVPHPSGRNLWYNDPKNRKRVGRLLERLSR
jgi:hypothetical protein